MVPPRPLSHSQNNGKPAPVAVERAGPTLGTFFAGRAPDDARLPSTKRKILSARSL
jgi:hypothetical protein